MMAVHGYAPVIPQNVTNGTKIGHKIGLGMGFLATFGLKNRILYLSPFF